MSYLDQSSLLCWKSLLGKLVVMDIYQEYILVTYRPFDVHIFHLTLLGELTLSSTPELQVWYPSLGVDFFKQEDFLQVKLYILVQMNPMHTYLWNGLSVWQPLTMWFVSALPVKRETFKHLIQCSTTNRCT